MKRNAHNIGRTGLGVMRAEHLEAANEPRMPSWPAFPGEPGTADKPLDLAEVDRQMEASKTAECRDFGKSKAYRALRRAIEQDPKGGYPS
jgi:hypothetical protein